MNLFQDLPIGQFVVLLSNKVILESRSLGSVVIKK